MAEDNKVGWDVVKALIAHNRKSKPQYKDIKISAEKRAAPPSYNVHGIIVDDEKTKPKE